MSLPFLPILTIFIIGLVSFFLGYWLMKSAWKSKYRELDFKLSKMDVELMQVKSEHKSSQIRINDLKNQNANLQQKLNNLTHQNIQLQQDIRTLDNEKQLLESRLESSFMSQNGQPIKNGHQKELVLEKAQLVHEAPVANEVANYALAQEQNYGASVYPIRRRINSILLRIGIGSYEFKDDLCRLNGIDQTLEAKLNRIGVYNYHQIANLQLPDLEDMDEALRIKAGKSLKDNWIGQAKAFINQTP